MIDIFTSWAVFVFLIGGLGLPLTANLHLKPDERLCLGIVIGCVVVYLAAWTVYWFGFPGSAVVALLFLAGAALLWRRQASAKLWRDSAVRSLAGLWTIVAGWCLGLLALIKNYSGGEWVGDWLEHYHRTIFFLDRLPLNTLFLNIYELPARPPFANLTLSAFLALTRPSFASYQVFLTLFSTLAFIPAALLARRFQRSANYDPAGWVAVLFMLNPLFVENATFAWTKLPATFFILAGLYFFLRPCALRPLATVTCLSAAILTHYSAVPYVVALAALAIWQAGHAWSGLLRWRFALPAAGAASGLLATWFGWSLWHFGPATFRSNTAMNNAEGLNWQEQIVRRADNLLSMVVPHPLRAADYSALLQESRAGWWRDYFFNLYQTNLLFALGTGGIVVISVVVWRNRHESWRFWGTLVLIILVLHTAVISWADRWGSVHIGLQPLILLGLAWIAASIPTLGKRIRICLAIGMGVDAVCGIVLHFWLQHIDLSTLYADYRNEESIRHLGFPAWSNYLSKAGWQLRFLGDQNFAVLPLMTIMALLLILAVRVAARARTPVPGLKV